MTVGYLDKQQQKQTIKCSWLIGADGKKGVVRKRFLEPDVGIKQEVGNYAYEGTWVAANLRITPPNPLTHPSLPFWDMNMTPDEVCDLYWPKGWHFCTPPGKATACGRFGPYEDRLWRHEFAEPEWNDSMDATALFWEHISPMITRKKNGRGTRFPQGVVEFPRDCIEILRCRPFVFVQKCVNKWFDKRRILIGDSAHVFPPFGGEGMSSGLRDAYQLAWRIALVETASTLQETASTRLLEGWEAERRCGIKDAVNFTKINGMLCNEPESWGFFIFRHLESLYKCLPPSLQSANARSIREAKGITRVHGGGFLAEYDGGGKLAQVFVESAEHQAFRSDELLNHSNSLLTLLVLGPKVKQRCLEAVKILDRMSLSADILSKEGLIALTDDLDAKAIEDNAGLTGVKTFSLTSSPTEDVFGNLSSYSPRPYLERLGQSTAFAVLRPDFYIFALARDASELERCLMKLRTMLE
jgi:2-polyprenyl-6-methoxyphenol hydroxylase-like FAD-dependent oxidoreductase